MRQRTAANPFLELLTGLIERVTFHSAETGFAVLRVQVKGHRDLVTVVGTIAEVHAGEWVEAEGCWAVDPTHGQQFRAEVLKTSQPVQQRLFHSRQRRLHGLSGFLHRLERVALVVADLVR
jgi:exodeoxyribonuclease V alpha subunit